MNVLAKTKKYFPGPIKGEDGRWARHPKFQAFLSCWNTLLASTTEQAYEELLEEMRVQFPLQAMSYCEGTWLLWKEKLVAFWQQLRPRHSTNIPLFAAVLQFVHGRALLRIMQENSKLPYEGPPPYAYLTTANIMFRVEEFDCYTENDIYRLFGKPETGSLETESGETPGAEAPRYIVKSLDFLSSETDIISNDISLIDFDQAFLVSSPPGEMLATPIEFLAPEVAVGRPASPASDVWALGCSIVRLRSGEGLFSAYDITSQADLMRGIIQALGDMPASWEDSLFDSDGQPTKDPAKGKPVWKFTDKRPIKEQIYRIWDNPSNWPSKSTKPLVVSQGENVD
ncbi:hypothetical protein IFR05_015846 [Cadophora sp. M221]|nr:hypothetical protein IFR05_015846 [Cadophora sp. M221]